MSELLPSLQADDVQRGLLDYLTTTFALADQDARLALSEFLTDSTDGIFKGPYVRLRLPFRPAADGWQSSLGWSGGFTPYGHQAQAWARLSSADLSEQKPRPLPTLVTTGTGSGKTEAFLYPILDHVLRERRAGRRGVKSLILYPMNALANDQAGRLARIITAHEELAGVTAALYTGQGGTQRTMVTAEGLITDRAVIRSEPPDILLTNYKMLDQLLLRADDQSLWRESALSLRYLVLDEFHTYDGAQGTDVAMLLRRLGLALKAYWPQDSSEVTQEDWARPLGRMTPVATSATLGDRGDPAAMVTFAHTVFGEEFRLEGVVTESRLTREEWLGTAAAEVVQWGLEAPDTADLEPQAVAALGGVDAAASRELALQVLAVLYQVQPAKIVDVLAGDDTRLLTLAKAVPLVQSLIGEAADAVSVDELAGRLTPSALMPVSGPALLAVIAMLSHVRAVSGRSAPTVETHLWVRELTRVDRFASASVRYRWSDDGPLAGGGVGDAFAEDERPAFPAVYCRHCGRSGWGIELGPTGLSLGTDDTVIRRNHAAREGRFRALLSAPLEAEHTGDVPGEKVEGLHWFAVRRREIVASAPQSDDRDFRDGWVLPVLMLTGPDVEDESRDDTCPSCLQKDGIRFLGSAIATLLSVTLSTMFGSADLDQEEKKALVFTDSVQDAAHRAGFVQSRSHTLTLRSVLRAAAEDGPVGLDVLVDEAIRRAGHDRFARYRLLPPELASRPYFRSFWQAEKPSAQSRTRVRRRLLFDAVMEFGLASRIGRTLEQTGSVVAAVEGLPASRLATIARSVLKDADGQQSLDEAMGIVTEQWLVAWVRGTLEHLRERGAVTHPWFDLYQREDGSRYRIWYGRKREEGMPAFPPGRAAPAFARVGPALAVKDPLLDPVTSAQSWYARWTARTLVVSPQHGARLARGLFDRLARADLLVASTTQTKGISYAIPASAILVQPTTEQELANGQCLLECSVCRTTYPSTPEVTDQLDGAPCMLVRCPGALHRVARPDNYYRRLYASASPRRIVAREHSSLLEDEVRLEYETAFKTGRDDPEAPNVLVATPTLEMGIDIGDLSTVMLASLPRTVASYLQRVGRAGRLTGNALNLAFVTGRGENLPRLGEPLSVINGQVRPPATYLNAEEILQRQYVAHLVDTLARDSKGPRPQRAAAALGKADDGSFLDCLVVEAEADATTHLDRFLDTFHGQSESTVQALRHWASPADGAGTSGLARHLFEASHRWTKTQDELGHRQATVQAALPGLDAAAQLPAATEDDKRAANSARAALKLTRAQIAGRRSQPWIQSLEEAGILPNYTLVDDDVSLDVALTWIDHDTGEFHSEPVSYRRSRANALREFAPGAVFYARGLEVQIDSIDLGVDGTAIRSWGFCPACGYARDREPGGAPVQASPCPRCGSSGILDSAQHFDTVELSRVTAEMRRDEATITDRRDERQRERFTIVVAADVNPASVIRQWYVDGYDFGVKYLRSIDIRWVNLGRGAGYGPQREIAGETRMANLFRVCEGCGKLDRATQRNRPEEHRPWCRYRSSAQEHTRSLALTRSLTTQGIVLRLPPSVTIGDSFAVPSLATSVLLGLHEQLGGSPDHIAIASIADPTLESDGGGRTDPALLLHDVVPGGTGYLAELADPERLWDLLHRAWVIVRDCPCRDEARLACHRCLLPYTGAHLPAELVSRQAAERHLRAILTSGAVSGSREVPDALDWLLTDVPAQAASTESHLEQYFRMVIGRRMRALGATVKDVPGPTGNSMHVSFPHSPWQWKLQPQVKLPGVVPDFVLQCNDPGVPPVAVFTDGWLYHASPSHNRLADDARKRADLRDQGYVVLGVTARDVDQADNPSTPSWFDAGVVSALMQSGSYQFGHRASEAIAEGPISWLLSWLQFTETAQLRSLAEAVPFFFARTPSQPGGVLFDSAVRALDENDDANVQQWWWASGACGVLARTSAATPGSVAVALVLDDRDQALHEDDHRQSWAQWLSIANALAQREQPTQITTVTEILAGHTTRPAAGAAGPEAGVLEPEWQELVDDAVDDERTFLLALLEPGAAGLPLPTLGFETAAGIPIDIAWPDHKIAVSVSPEDIREDLEADGWHVFDPDAQAVRAVIEAI